MKICMKCKIELPLENFYKHPFMKAGFLNKCKLCAKQYARLRRLGANRQKILEADRIRSKGKYTYAKTKDYRERNKEKYKAHMLAYRIPKKPCEICGTLKRIHRHHDDYSKPLQVRFLCHAHHAEYHRKINLMK